MLAIGITYPELKILSKIDNIKGLEEKARDFNYTTTLTLNNVENIELVISDIEKNWINNESDFGIILTDKNNKRKYYHINISQTLSIFESICIWSF